MPVKWKDVYVFISSTFNDMHAERDLLVKQVFPELEEWCEEHRLRLIDIDLRWGVTEADAQENKRVVQVCLDRIDRCRPFFLCFLGQRRGWVPGKSDISAETFAEFPELGGMAGSASVTEMEILHALIRPLANANRPGVEVVPAQHAFFYLREPDYLNELPADPPQLRNVYTNDAIKDDAARLAADDELNRWRRTVIRQTDRPVREYSCSWDAAERTPEIRLPLECPSGAEPGSPTWRTAHTKWAEQWASFDVQVPETGEIVDPVQRERAERANDRLTRGRLGQFTTGVQSLADAVVGDLQEAIRQRHPDHFESTAVEPLPQQNEIDQQARFLKVASEGYIERPGDFDALDRYAQAGSGHLFILTAPAGMGKTTLLARWIDRQRQKPSLERTIFYRFVGAGDLSTRVEVLLASLLEEMAQAFGVSVAIPADPEKLRTSWLEVASETCGARDALIVIDSLNQLESGLADLQWLARDLSGHVQLLVSITTGAPGADAQLQSLTTTGGAEVSEVRPFGSIEDRRTLVQTYLSRYLKDLDEHLLEELIRQPGAENPLYLKVLLAELRVFGAFDQLSARTRAFGREPVAAFGAVLERMEDDPAYAPLSPREAIPAVFGALSVARHGLSVPELVSVLLGTAHLQTDGQTVAAAEQTIRVHLRQMRPYLAWRDKRFDFFYDSFRQAAAERYRARLPEFHSDLVKEFSGRSDPGGTEQYSMCDPRALQELPFHLAGAGMAAELVDLLGSLRYLHARCGTGAALDLVADYGLLPDKGRSSPHFEFLRKDAQKITRYPNSLFSLVAFEGSEEQKREAARLASDGRWPEPWIRMEPLRFDGEANSEARPSLKITARFDHDRACAVDTARSARLSFWVKSIGQVAILNALTMEPLRQVITTARKRPLAIRCSPDGKHLVLAYDDGEAEVIQVAYSDDGTLPYQTPAGSFRYHLPEVEAPRLSWDGDDLWYQVAEGRLARRRFADDSASPAATETFYDLPSDLTGELSLIVARDEQLLIGLRQRENTTLAAGSGGRFVALATRARTDIACYAYDATSKTAAVVFSDSQVFLYDMSAGFTEVGRLQAAGDVRAIACDGGQVVLATRRLAIYSAAMRNGAEFSKLIDEGSISKGIYVLADGMASLGPRQWECTTDLGVMQLASATGAVDSASTWKALYTRPDGECLGVRLQDRKQVSAVDFRSDGETILAREGGSLYVTGLDGLGNLFAAHISGLAVFLTSAGELSNSSNLPPGGISAAGDAEGGFWLCEGNGTVYRVELADRATCRAFNDLKGYFPSGSAIAVHGGRLFWQGVTSQLLSYQPNAELVMVVFKTKGGRLSQPVTIPLPKSDGHFACYAYDPVRENLFIVQRIVGTEKWFIRCGTPEALAAGHGTRVAVAMDHEAFHRAEYVSVNGKDRLLLLSLSGNMFVLDLESGSILASFCPEAALTQLGIRADQNRPLYCAINDKHVYRCTLEMPS